MVEHLENWRKAGKIGSICRDYGARLIKKGASYLDLAEKVEAKIRSMDAEVAFPMNINCNEIASHDIPKKDDPRILGDDLCTIDVGVSVEGAIADTAVTVDLTGNYAELKKASEEALKAAIKLLAQEGAECSYGAIGKTIQETVESFGYKPVVNLSGHSLKEYTVHAGYSIPNYNNKDSRKFTPHTIYAIEPFVTLGRGLIKESSHPEIFMQHKSAHPRSQYARDVLAEIAPRKGLPFAKRWLQTKGAELGVRELLRANVLRAYPPLVDVDGKMVVQTEHTIYVSEDSCEVLTKKVEE